MTKMNCLYTGMQWNKRSRSPKLVLEAILLQRMLVFEQFVSASKLAPEVLKERNRVWGFCLWHDWIIKFAWVPPRALPPFPPLPPLGPLILLWSLYPIVGKLIMRSLSYISSPPPQFTLCWPLLILPLFYLKTVWFLQNLPPLRGKIMTE